jgi:VWFA-related protein
MIGFFCRQASMKALLLIGFLWPVLLPQLYSQEIQTTPRDISDQTARTERSFKISVAVDEVRLDAVVVDRKGYQITDLTAEEFEIYQDNQLQTISSCTYINDSPAEPGKGPQSPIDSRELSPLPPPVLAPDGVRRAIAFLVDDLSLNFTNIYFARVGLEKFVKTQMQPGDLVAILRTSRGVGAQFFSSDKRQLLAIIKEIRWDAPLGAYSGGISQAMAISYSIRALQDMPGRKYLIMMSSLALLNGNMTPDYKQSTQPGPDFSIFNLMADAALRAGVVIHTLPFGVSMPMSPWSTIDISTLENSPTEIPLSKKTGGIYLQSNFFSTRSGIGRVSEEIKGYYLLTYAPPAGTFKPNKQAIYHRVMIKVKRPGSEVHTRDGFFGMTDPPDTLARQRNALREAIFSPFRYNDLKVNLAFGYVDNPLGGYMLRSWLHVDARDLGIIDEKDGAGTIALEAACVTSGTRDFIQDVGNMGYEFRINKGNVPWLRDHGLRFSLELSAKKAGPYYVRVVVRDAASGKIGSAYQFIEIPELNKHRLALSSIFVISREEDADWINSSKSLTARTANTELRPDLRRDPRRNPAFRSYHPGDSFEYMAIVYNAKAKDNEPPDLEYHYVLYRNGSELFKSESKAVDLSDVKDFKRIPIRQKVGLDETVQPGDYVLQLRIKDKRAKENYSLAAQTLDFQVLEKQTQSPVVSFSGESP